MFVPEQRGVVMGFGRRRALMPGAALIGVSNDRMLARLIHGAHLVLYPGAGHGFLFQDSRMFVSVLKSFLG